MQGAQHEAIAAERDDDVRRLRGRVAVAANEAARACCADDVSLATKVMCL